MSAVRLVPVAEAMSSRLEPSDWSGQRRPRRVVYERDGATHSWKQARNKVERDTYGHHGQSDQLRVALKNWREDARGEVHYWYERHPLSSVCKTRSWSYVAENTEQRTWGYTADLLSKL